MTRKIVHIDMDAFYASVEQRDDTTLKGKPVLVGGDPNARGVVSTASYEARKFGARSAMAMKTALSLCPNAVVIRPQFEKYKAISNEIRAIFFEYTDLVEPLSLDEAYLDVTENKKNIFTATDVAKEIKTRIRRELALTASAGVAPNKLLAKIASDIRKPDGLFVITPSKVQRFMKTLPVGKLWGVGNATLEKLAYMSVKTAGDLQTYDEATLRSRFGKLGSMLYHFCRGEDDRLVEPEREPKSIGSETTFPEDITDMRRITEALLRQAKETSERAERQNVKGRAVTLKAKYADFETITRSASASAATNDYETIAKLAAALIKKTEAGTRPLRLLGVTLSRFDGEADYQQTFTFPEDEESQEER